MVLKAYYDGCSDGHQREAVTLTGVAATEEVWPNFEQAWTEALRKHLVKDDIVHMVDLMGFHENFSRGNGWDENQRRALLVGLFNVWGKLYDYDLEARSCTVMLDDWKRADKQLEQLPEPEVICVNFCVGGLRLPLSCGNEPKPVLLYFDKNEPFMHKINRVWQRKRKIANTLFSQIRTIEKADSRCFPIQAADILAWIVNHSDRGLEDAFLDISSVIAIRHSRLRYDYEKIVEHYPPPLGWLKPNTQSQSNAQPSQAQSDPLSQ
jgi:hypothetical protein